MNLGLELKNHRESNGYSQIQVAQATQITQAAISRWESNLRIPNIIDCITLADFYGITLDELVGRDCKAISPTVTYNNSTHNGNNIF